MLQVCLLMAFVESLKCWGAPFSFNLHEIDSWVRLSHFTELGKHTRLLTRHRVKVPMAH